MNTTHQSHDTAESTRDVESPRTASADEPPDPEPTWKQGALNVIRYSPLNVLLVCVPIAWALHLAHVSDSAIFTVSALALIPLAALLGLATEEIAHRLGPTLGGLANATLGNTIELIVAIIALVDGKLRIVQSAMIGSILSNALLVLGCCFLAGGLVNERRRLVLTPQRFHEQGYEIRSAQLQINMLGLSALAIVIPAAYSASVRWNVGVPGGVDLSTSEVDRKVLQISRGTAVILILVYAALLFFQLKTHAYLYRSEVIVKVEGPSPQPPADAPVIPWKGRRSSTSTIAPQDVKPKRKLSLRASVALLLLVTALAGVTAEFLVDSIDGLTATGNISQEFVALILLPLVSNAAEHVTAVVASVKDRLDLSMHVAIGSSIQIALLVYPVLILLGWAIGQPLDLGLDLLEVILLFLGVLLVTNAIGDARSNWSEGLVLIAAYVLMALAAFLCACFERRDLTHADPIRISA